MFNSEILFYFILSFLQCMVTFLPQRQFQKLIFATFTPPVFSGLLLLWTMKEWGKERKDGFSYQKLCCKNNDQSKQILISVFHCFLCNPPHHALTKTANNYFFPHQRYSTKLQLPTSDTNFPFVKAHFSNMHVVSSILLKKTTQGLPDL